MPYSVCQVAAFGNILVNHFPLVLNSLPPLTSKNRKNFSTRIPNSFANRKCPNSWMIMSMESARMTCRIFISTTMAYPFFSSASIFLSARARISLSVMNMSSSDGSLMNVASAMHSAAMSEIP